MFNLYAIKISVNYYRADIFYTLITYLIMSKKFLVEKAKRVLTETSRKKDSLFQVKIFTLFSGNGILDL